MIEHGASRFDEQRLELGPERRAIELVFEKAPLSQDFSA
jgi:hypothetical protein